ncbi:MAG: hypothetical protein AAGE99_03320, partial [Chlamydiota bacterium]
MFDTVADCLRSRRCFRTGTIIENLASIDSLRASLEYAMSHPKTSAGSQAIRDSVKHLDHSDQL